MARVPPSVVQRGVVMIDFTKDGNRLLLSYWPEPDDHWLARNLRRNDRIRLRQGVFEFQPSDFYDPTANEVVETLNEMESHGEVEPENNTYLLAVGEIEGDYYRLTSRVFGVKHTFYFHEHMRFSTALFIAERNTSILRKIDELVSGDVYVGGTRDGAIPQDAYLGLIKRFPNTYELRRYAAARVSGCLREYLDNATDAELLYQKYMNKRAAPAHTRLFVDIRQTELAKYEALLLQLKTMLANEDEYNERQWQDEIAKFILLLYPKYIQAFPEVRVPEAGTGKHRRIDFMLVDFSGAVDIIEIKRPFGHAIVSKSEYRDNHIPLRDLSGTIMQVEKYIYHLSRWGWRGEESLSAKYRDRLPDGLEIKVINPRGFVIMGRENALTTRQRDDFEVIKRKYRNVIDVITYDDLLARLALTISQLQSGVEDAATKR